MAEIRRRKGTPSSPPDSEDIKAQLGQESKTTSFWCRLGSYLFYPEDGSYLGVFRIVWGLIMMYEVYLLINDGFVVTISRYYLNPYSFAFKYYGFEWVTVVPFQTMVLLLLGMQLAAFCIAIGFLYSVASKLFFFGICYLFLLESTNYLNHMYLVCVLAGILMFLPLGRFYSLSNCCRRTKPSPTVPK